MADIGWRRRRGSSPAARTGARQRAGLTPASASNTLSCQRETLHSQQLRSIKKSIDSDHGIYRDRREFITLLGGVSLLRNSRLAVILFAASLIILWGNAAMAMTLNSPAFQQNGHIPSKYTCEGEDVSPPLAWEGAPNGAKSLVLIIDDPDAPDPKAPKMVWVHWVVYNMPPDTKSLPENAGKARLPQGALLGLNDFKKTGYGGP